MHCLDLKQIYLKKSESVLFIFIYLFIYFYDKAYLGNNSKKLVTNGMYHIVTADKYTPR